MEATLLAGIAGLLGLVLGRFWDSRSEATRWRRDQRIRTYERVGGSYHTLRQAIRRVALLEPGTTESDEAASHALDLAGEFNTAIMAVWLHGSASVASAVRELDREVVKMFVAARERKYSWEEWRVPRAPAEQALERFVAAVRSELSLPRVAVAIRIDEAEAANES